MAKEGEVLYRLISHLFFFSKRCFFRNRKLVFFPMVTSTFTNYWARSIQFALPDFGQSFAGRAVPQPPYRMIPLIELLD